MIQVICKSSIAIPLPSVICFIGADQSKHIQVMVVRNATGMIKKNTRFAELIKMYPNVLNEDLLPGAIGVNGALVTENVEKEEE